MKKLRAYSGDCDQALQSIFNSKHSIRKNRLIANLESIKLRCVDYRLNVSALEIINSVIWPDDLKDDLLHCYESSTIALEKLKSNIRAIQEELGRAVCQYCGINEPSTEDHYLPKHDFPEFSVYGLNLIPCCIDCNSKKGRAFKFGVGREILNLYFDNIPAERFLFCELDYSAGREAPPRVKFNMIQGPIDSEVFKQVEAHFKRLNLLIRFVDQAAMIISNVEHTLCQNGKCEMATLKGLISEKRDMVEFQYGINSWRAAIYFAIENSNDFLSKFCI